MFELHITCTKDIDNLAIDFSDGTSVIKSKSDPQSLPTQDNSISSERDKLDLDSVFGILSKEVVEKPQIPDIRRSPKVAGELQNFNL